MMEFILSHVEKGVMTLTLNRPERLNSFNDEMHAQLAECLKQVERDDTIRCLLLTGAGRGFCAGQDLNDRNVDPTGPAPDLGMSVERFYNPTGTSPGKTAKTGDLCSQWRGGRGRRNTGTGGRHRYCCPFSKIRHGVS